MYEKSINLTILLVFSEEMGKMHKFKIIIAMISLVLISSTFFVFFDNQHTRASEIGIFVDDDQIYPNQADGSLYNPYKYIQDAIEAAEDGDIIKVLEGRYPGDLQVDKSVTITSEDRSKAIIHSSLQNAYVIDIVADSVSLEHFTIQDTTSTSHRKAAVHVSTDVDSARIIDVYVNYSKNGYGIQVDGASNCIIRNCTLNYTRGIIARNSNILSIDNNFICNSTDYSGVNLVSSNGNKLNDNFIENNKYGIYFESCNNNIINDNLIQLNTNSGILIQSGEKTDVKENDINNNDNVGLDVGSSSGDITENEIYNNQIGLRLSGSSNTIFENNIFSCSFYGAHCLPSSKNNVFYNNNFTNKNVYHAYEEGNNQWDNDVVGNYWDDFYGPDPDNLNNTVFYDFIEVPEVYKYKIGGVEDNYPKGKYQKEPVASNPSPGSLEEGVDRSPRLSVVVNDPDPQDYRDRLDVYFYYKLDNETNLIEVDRNVESGSTASVWFTSKIQGKNAVYSYEGLGYDYICEWFVEVEDSYSRTKSSEFIFTTLNTPVDNEKPIIDIKIPAEFQSGDEVVAQINDTITFDGSKSYDPDGEIIFYKWTFPPDSSVINQNTSSHKFRKEGTYTVSLVVIDNNGSSDISNKTVNIVENENRPPVADGYFPDEALVGTTIYFDGSGTSDPDPNDELSYLWDFGDGSDISIEQSATHSYVKPGKYTVQLTVSDSGGKTDYYLSEINIKAKKKEESPGLDMYLLITVLLLAVILLKNKNKK